MRKLLYISLLLLFIPLIYSCEDSLGIDDYSQMLIEGDSLENIDSRRITTFDTTEIEDIIIRIDTVIYNDTLITYDTIYVGISDTYTDFKINYGISTFYEIYDTLGVLEKEYKWFPNVNNSRDAFEIIYDNKKPIMKINLNLLALRTDFQGNMSSRDDMIESINIEAEIGTLRSEWNQVVLLNGGPNSNKYSRIVKLNKNGSREIFEANTSTLSLMIFQYSIISNQFIIGLTARIPSTRSQTGFFIFDGLLFLEPR